MSTKREMWVDYTKLFACILVVVGHLLQGLNQAGVVWNNTLYAYINELIYNFHMPLFMCLSGYLYGKYTKINSKEDYKHFICKKLVNLGIPYITFYSLTVFISMIFSSSVNNHKGISDILNMFIKPISPYWFIYVLLAIFIIVPVIEKIFKKKYILILLSFLIFHIVNILLGGFNIYIISKLAEYLVYFYIGINIVQISEKCKCNSVLLLIIFFSLDMLVAYLNINNILNTTLISISKTIIALISLLTFVSLFHRSEDVKEENYLKSNNTEWQKLKEQMYASGGGYQNTLFQYS